MDFLVAAVKGSRIPRDRVSFEITETSAVERLDQAREFIAAVKAAGCSFALDDFGSGVSSFGYLRSLPVDTLKIDGSLVTGIGDDPVSEAMVSAIHQVAQVMALTTVAEYVETETIKERLRAIGIDYAQGWGVGRPEPIESFWSEGDGLKAG